VHQISCMKTLQCFHFTVVAWGHNANLIIDLPLGSFFFLNKKNHLANQRKAWPHVETNDQSAVCNSCSGLGDFRRNPNEMQSLILTNNKDQIRCISGNTETMLRENISFHRLIIVCSLYFYRLLTELKLLYPLCTFTGCLQSLTDFL
jgi:hypothetical protein